MRGGLGCLLIIAAVVILVVVMIIPVLPGTEREDFIDDYLQPVLCPEGWTVDRDLYESSDSEGTSYSMEVFCERRGEKDIDVTDKWTAIGIVGFVAPLLLGILIIVVGVTSRARRAAQNMLNRTEIGGLNNLPNMSSLSSLSSIGTALTSAQNPTSASMSNAPNSTFQPWVEQKRAAERPYVPQTHPQDNLEPIMHPKDEYAGLDSDLVARLKELKQARDSGLISGEEHDRLRREVLDSWTKK